MMSETEIEDASWSIFQIIFILVTVKYCDDWLRENYSE